MPSFVTNPMPILTLSVLLSIPLLATADDISPQSLGASYGELTATGIQLFSSAGEPVVGTASGTNVEVTCGFIAAIKGAVVNESPKVTSDTLVIARLNEIFQYEATATDREGLKSVSFLNFPSWMNVVQRFISGTPSRTNVDTSFLVIATDMGGISDTARVIVQVLTPNSPVVITSTKSITVVEHTHFTYTATVRDHLTLQSITYAGFPSWMQVNRDTIQGTPPEGATDTSFRVIALGASSSSDIITVAVDVIPVNDPPVITSSSKKGVITNTLLDYTATATDPEGAAVTIEFENLPSWLTANGARVTGTPTAAATDTSFVVKASDGVLLALQTVEVRVQPVNSPPQITSPLAVSATQHRYFVYHITATDPESNSGDLAISIASQLPSWLTFRGDSVFGTPRTRGIGTVSLIAKVTDGFTPVEATITVTVKDSNATPWIVFIPDSTCSPVRRIELRVLGNDLDTGKLTYALLSGPAAMTLDSLNGYISWWPSDADTGKTFVVAVQVKDRDGATGRDTFNLRVTQDPRPRCVLDTIAHYQRGIVRIPFRLSDATNDAITLGLEYRLSQGMKWKSSTAIRDGSGLTSAKYIGFLTWTTTAEDTLSGRRHDSVWVRVTPVDAGSGGLGDSTLTNKPFILDNSPSLILADPSPARGSRIPAYAIPEFKIRPRQGVFDPSTVSDLKGTVLMTGAHQGAVALRLQCTDSLLAIAPNERLNAGDTFTVTLSGKIKDSFGKYLDGNGDSVVTLDGTESISWSFTTGYLADFNGDDSVDVKDVVKAAAYWMRSAKNNWRPTDSIIEAGPATGVAPYFKLSPDAVFDYRDLGIFLRMWYWIDGTRLAASGGRLAKSLAAETEDLVGGVDGETVVNRPYAPVQQKPALSKSQPRMQNSQLTAEMHKGSPSLRLDLAVDGITNLAACRYRVWGGSGLSSVETQGSLLEKDADAVVLTREGAGWNEATIARFSSNEAGVTGSGNAVTMWIAPPSLPKSRLTLEYQLVDGNGKRIEDGVVDLGESPIVTNGKDSITGVRQQALISAPNPMTVSPRHVIFELIDRPQSVSWITNDRAGTIFRFTLKGSEELSALRCGLTIRNSQMGAVVQTSVRDVLGEILDAGGEKTYTVFWDGRDARGVPCRTGVYEVTLKWDNGRSRGEQRFVVGVR